MKLEWKRNDIEMMSMDEQQLNLFDIETPKRMIGKRIYSHESTPLGDDLISKLKKYTLEQYIQDVEKMGLKVTWDYICSYSILCNGANSFLDIDNFGELYEIGLAIKDKNSKKKSGQYYTPDDIASVMSGWLAKCDGENVCDVACGTGKLIITYLNLIGYERARELISKGQLYLYDFDDVALKICWTILAIKYGQDISSKINDVFCDFLDPKIRLPKNAKVISNPPYAHLDEIQDYWERTDVLMSTKEFYSAFMEKICNQSKTAVIITPFSFISSSKFYALRKEMCELGNGFVVSFDNVPGNIFCGRKHGIFNTNTANSVRAAITVFHKDSIEKGFGISQLIRFKNEQRKDLLKCNVLESLISKRIQIIDSKEKTFKKIEDNLWDIYLNWTGKSKYYVKDIISKNETEYMIDMPNTCRYYTTACSRKLRRKGSITLYANDTDSFNFLYCIINSSFAYWWWRIYDGGIIYPTSLLISMPVPLNLLNEDDKVFFNEMRIKMSLDEKKYLVTKVNAGVPQENIKFPELYRCLINQRILKILGCDEKASVFDDVHSNFINIESKH